MHASSRALRNLLAISVLALAFLFSPVVTHADTLSITSGNNVTTTPNVATAVTGFQIIGAGSTVTPVKLFSTSGTLSMSTTTGLTFDGASTGSVIYFSGTVANINAALATLTYTRATTGTDTLEVSLVPKGEAFFTGNNHLYKFITGTISWNNARPAALNQTAYGINGYLATITSPEENAFVSGRLTGDGWIGASDSVVEGDWRWIDGPEAGTLFWRGAGNGTTQGGNYASWTNQEPNDSGGNEDCAETYVSSGSWNDLPCDNTVSGYVVEFGAPGNLPSVVAKNISVTTADVPAVASLSPANGAVAVSPSANIVITFTKAVTAQTGNILIKKVSDNSTIATIGVTSAQVTGSGTTAITIDPTDPLAEGTSYYVVIPSTAFADSSNNFFAGITTASTWQFTTSDITPPVISNVAAAGITNTTAIINWNTNELASTKVSYGLTNTYGSTTAETDTAPRVTSHTLVLSSLLACTDYHFKVTSTDGFGNTANGSDVSFTTTGCSSNVAPTTTTSTTVTSASGGSTSLTDNDTTITVAAPANATSVASSYVIQVKAIPGEAVLADLGAPAAVPEAVGPTIFDVKAIVNGTTILDSFDAPVTITYQYSNDDIQGLNESSLWLYHYHNGSWLPLDSCAVDQGTNTISCTTQGFSIFALFGKVATTDSGSGYVSGGGKPYGATVAVATPVTVPAVAQGTCPAYTFTRQLRKGMTGEDVRALQQFLNCAGFTVAATGPGSAGKETDMFSAKTYAAVVKFQEAYAADVLTPGGFTKATGIFANYSQAKAATLMGK